MYGNRNVNTFELTSDYQPTGDQPETKPVETETIAFRKPPAFLYREA